MHPLLAIISALLLSGWFYAVAATPPLKTDYAPPDEKQFVLGMALYLLVYQASYTVFINLPFPNL